MNNKSKKIVNPEIKSLLREVIPNIKLKDIRTIIDIHKYDVIKAVEYAQELDKTIGGIGIHNVNRPTGKGTLTGIYDIINRPIYRPIQYVYNDLFFLNLEWRARDIVYKSCLHLESCLDRYCEEKINGPFGRMLHSEKGMKLPKHIWNPLDAMCKNVYNLAKHYIPLQPNYDDHLFSEVDALATYFICRKLGIEILRLIP